MPGNHLKPTRSARVDRWLVALLYTLLIFAFAWGIPNLWDTLTGRVGTERAGGFVDAVVPAIGILLAAPVAILLLFRGPLAWFWMAVAVAGYIYLLTLYADYPVERIHLVQYSLVAWLYYRAIRLDCGRPAAYLGAAIAVLIVGALDEWQQEIIPERAATLQDMILNWTAGGLGLVALIALQKEGPLGWMRARTHYLRWSMGLVAPALIVTVLAHQVWTRYINPPINLVLITVDCARADRMGFNGYLRPNLAGKPASTTRYLDSLSGEAAIFDNAYSQAAWTGAGVVSTLSGLYPPTHGVTTAGRTLPKVADTILDLFQERGYRVPNLTYLTVDQTFKNFADMEDPGIDVSNGEINVLNNWIARNHREPFAIWYHWRFMHLPYDPPLHHRRYPPLSDPEAAPPEHIAESVMEEVIVPLDTVEFTEEDQSWLDSLFDAQVRFFDSAFESIRYRLALHHKLKHTLFVITADHGEELLDHGYIGHASTAVHSRHYDEHLHIPLYIWGPRLIKEGRRIATPAQQVDILPTICELMGWPIPEEAQGRSLVPAIRGEPMPDVPVFAESVEGGYQAKPEMMNTFLRSVRTKDWKLIARMSPEGDGFELYDLADDPLEKHNVFDKHPAKAGELITLLAEWITETQDARFELEERQRIADLREAAKDPENLEVPTILAPKDGDTLYYETHEGAVRAQWTGNEHAAYIIEYDVGEGWHRLQGKYPVPEGTSQVFGPLPKDGWKPLHQWNPYRLRIRPRGLPDGWSDWITVTVAPLQQK